MPARQKVDTARSARQKNGRFVSKKKAERLRKVAEARSARPSADHTFFIASGEASEVASPDTGPRLGLGLHHVSHNHSANPTCHSSLAHPIPLPLTSATLSRHP